MKNKMERKVRKITGIFLMMGLVVLANSSITLTAQIHLPTEPEFEQLPERISEIDEELKMSLPDKAWRWVNLREKVFSENWKESFDWMETVKKTGKLPYSPMLAHAPARQWTIDYEIEKLSEPAQAWLKERDRVYLENQKKASAWIEMVRRANR